MKIMKTTSFVRFGVVGLAAVGLFSRDLFPGHGESGSVHYLFEPQHLAELALAVLVLAFFVLAGGKKRRSL